LHIALLQVTATHVLSVITVVLVILSFPARLLIGDTPLVDLLLTPSLLRNLADTQGKELAVAIIA
jgi:hypothetical protein